MKSKRYYADFLIIGSGIAGLSFAIKASRHGSVYIVTKKKETDSSTNYAQGGIASVLDPKDSKEAYINDTIEAGAGLCHKNAVDVLVNEGPSRIQELIDWGTHFSFHEDSDGKRIFDLGREGGHSFNRIAHAQDLTGREIERALIKKVSSIDNIRIFENHTSIDLLTEHQLKFLSSGKGSGFTTCYGAYILENKTGNIHTFNSRTTLIAAGGVGQIYYHTTNPEIATGDGIAMAYRAGALISDMEFIQFHPTAFYQDKPEGSSFLILIVPYTALLK